MIKRKHSFLTDLSFQAMLVLMFVAIVFFAFDHANFVTNGIILCGITTLFLVTYFTSLNTGLILNLLFIFLFIAYVALRSLNQGIKISGNVYFWLFWPMAMVIAISLFVKEHQLLDEENVQMLNKLEKFVTIDELTQMNNLLGFERDAMIYMNISRRYELQLVLILWKVSYQKDLERLLGKDGTQAAVGRISDSIKKSLRKEDLVYLVDHTPYMWGTLLFSKANAVQIVIDHVQESVYKTDLSDITTQKNVSLEMRGVAVTYDGKQMTPLAFLEQVKKQLQKESKRG